MDLLIEDLEFFLQQQIWSPQITPPQVVDLLMENLDNFVDTTLYAQGYRLVGAVLLEFFTNFPHYINSDIANFALAVPLEIN